MTDRDPRVPNEQELDSLLKECLPDLPPDAVVNAVTPWKQGVRRVLWGMALSALTLNFWMLNYILPTVGMVLLLLGFRILKHENRWFRCCFRLTVLRAVLLFSRLILGTTILRAQIPLMGQILNWADALFLLLLLFLLRSGLRSIRHKAGSDPRIWSANALIIWYITVCALGLLHYTGLIIPILLIIGYILIIRSLFRLSNEMEESGYVIHAVPSRLSDPAAALMIAALLAVGCLCGYLFGSSYSMEWTPVSEQRHSEVLDTKAHLIGLGFPEAVLEDMTAADISACEGAVQVLTDVGTFPANPGKKVSTVRKNGNSTHIQTETVYDIRELRITGIAVKLPGNRDRWRIIHHFEWVIHPGFRGTESIQLWSADRNGGWGSDGEVTGQVLYSKDGVTFAAPYHSLGSMTYTADSILFGQTTSTDTFATFSLPNEGERQRCYLTYSIAEQTDGWIVDSWVNYTHQVRLLQYPVSTAAEHRMRGAWLYEGAFRTVQDALQFFSNDDGVKPIS